ncbi:hypothetical protein GGR54DRAFT_635650 [Hypoxylon sp. NC1633]|nr:hypothetical protein GGR54DRAFT_635650 [Hypoxylon sp. NC1633]
MFRRLPRPNRLGISRPQAHHNQPMPSRAPFASSAARPAVLMDQTRKSNDPAQDQKEGHQAQATETGEGEEHPAKQPDPQPSPSKSTGIRSEGPGGSRAGEGKVADGGVLKAGAGQDSG